MSLLTTHLLAALYDEVRAHDIEYKADAFWQAYLQSSFPPDEDYAVCCQWSPGGNDDRHRVDIAVRQLRFNQQQSFMATLLFCEVKRHGQHPRDAEDQLKDAARRYFETNQQAPGVYGMSGWGTKARCWLIRRPSNGQRVTLSPFFGIDSGGVKTEYIDAASSRARSITDSIRRMKGIEETAQNSPVVAEASTYTVRYGQGPGY